MSEIKDRLVQQIAEKGVKKADLAKSADVTPAAITRYCSGQSIPSRRVIIRLAATLGVTAEWLETGEGEMFREMSVYEELADYVAKFRHRPPDQFELQLILALSRLSPEKWSLLEEIASDMVKQSKKE